MAERRVRTRTGNDRTLDDSQIDKLAIGLRGPLLRPDDAGYDVARKVWNGMVDKRPGLIARCGGPVRTSGSRRPSNTGCTSWAPSSGGW